MFTRILHNSERLCTFFDQLELQLYRPQRQHILNMADALLVCEDDKTLAALQRQFVDAPDASNMADCLRISPWAADDVRTTLRAYQVAWVWAKAEQAGPPRLATSTSTTPLARNTRPPAIWNPSIFITTTTTAPNAHPATRTAFVIWCAPCASASSWSRSICGSICGPRRCGGSIATAPPSSALLFAAKTRWRAKSWKPYARCCPQDGRFMSSSTVGTPRPNCSTMSVARDGM